MRKLFILFSALLITFLGIWVFKSKTPIERVDAEVIANNSAWWDSGEEIVADVDWILDAEIPDNYIPVPSEDELYMVIDENGNIIEYRQRTLQEDGSWLWKTVNPDIPENYEAVAGLADVYKVTNEDGTVTYYKYIRNEDDTFAFIEVDENGNVIEFKNPEGSEIPDNYKHITGNIYAVYNENGVVVGYKERKIDDNGNYYWIDCEKPNVQTSNGNYNNPYTSEENNDTDTSLKSPIIIIEGGNNQSNNNNNSNNNSNPVTTPPTTQGKDNIVTNKDGTYTQTDTIISTETKGGWVYTYQTVVYKIYDAEGKLLSTKKEGPTEISKVQASSSNTNAPDKSKIASTLSAEQARVSVGLQYNNNLANEVLANINAERASAGLSSLSMTNNTNAYKMATIRASDMAIYNHSDYDSPMYGTIQNMCDTFNIKTSASELIWKTSADKTATAIASRLKIMSGNALLGADCKEIGISIVSKNGYYYIDVIIM